MQPYPGPAAGRAHCSRSSAETSQPPPGAGDYSRDFKDEEQVREVQGLRRRTGEPGLQPGLSEALQMAVGCV